MKTSIIKIAGSILAALALAGSAFAGPIQGEIFLGSGFNQPASINTTTKTVTFQAGVNAKVNGASGDYLAAGINGSTTATLYGFTYNPFVPQTIWMIDATTYFVLESITSITFGPGINPGFLLQGQGTAYLAGFDATAGGFSFSADATTTKFNWSSTTSVPEGGLTAAMLGLALLGVGFAARRQKRA